MRIAFTGHRDQVCAESDLAAIYAEFPNAEWSSGDAVGFDNQVESFARAHGTVTSWAVHGEVLRRAYASVWREGVRIVAILRVNSGKCKGLAHFDHRRVVFVRWANHFERLFSETICQIVHEPCV